MRSTKLDIDNNELFRCCGCCHVRTGTIAFGAFALLIELLLLAAFFVSIFEPDVIPSLVQNEWFVKTFGKIAIKDSADHASLYSTGFQFAGFVIIVKLLFTIMLLYGAIKAQSSFVMPYFCVQLLEFCLSIVCVMSYFVYPMTVDQYSNVMDAINEQKFFWKVFFFVFIAIFLKAYLLRMVWLCYTYLRARARVMIMYSSDDLVNTGESQMFLPPKYEDVLKMAEDEPSPPPYSPLTSEQA